MFGSSGSPLLWLIGVIVILGAFAVIWKRLGGRTRDDSPAGTVSSSSSPASTFVSSGTAGASAPGVGQAGEGGLGGGEVPVVECAVGPVADPAGDGRESVPPDFSNTGGSGVAAEVEVGPPDETVLVPAAPARTPQQLAAAIRAGRREYWADRWILGEDACEQLRSQLRLSQVQWASTVVDPDPKSAAVGGFIDELQRVCAPLAQLRLTRYQASLKAWDGEDETAVNPHRAAVCAGRYVSPDPTFGLHRLTAEVGLGLALARLDIARLTASLGSQTGAQLRELLGRATAGYRGVQADLFGPFEGGVSVGVSSQWTAGPGGLAGALQRWEEALLYGVWVRRYVQLLARQPRELEWAQASADAALWARLARRAVRLAFIRYDLAAWEQPLEVEAAHRSELARAVLLLDAHDSARAPLQTSTAQRIVAACEEFSGVLPIPAEDHSLGGEGAD